MTGNNRRNGASLIELYISTALIFTLFNFVLLVFRSLHFVDRTENPNHYWFPPTEWSWLVFTFIASPLFPAILLTIFGMVQRIFLPREKRLPLWRGKKDKSSALLREENDAKKWIVILPLLIFGLLEFVLLPNVARHNVIEWYPLHRSNGYISTIDHPKGFSVGVVDNWGRHLVKTTSLPSLRTEITFFGRPTGTSFFTITMLDQQPDVSGMNSIKFQNEPAWESVNPNGGHRVVCLEYALVFQRHDKWFRIDYWFPNKHGKGLYHTDLPTHMREYLETFKYTPATSLPRKMCFEALFT